MARSARAAERHGGGGVAASWRAGTLERMKLRLVALTGAGMSAESGIPTFRGTDGLWENYRIEDVATPEAWARSPETVLAFYNLRRKKLLECQPNAGHRGLAALESKFDVHIVTQNIDNLHERAGSTKVLHLHGELMKARSTVDPELIYDLPGWELKLGERCAKGSQLRPHIVWFGEEVPMIEPAAEIVSRADILAIIGTSLQVWPASALASLAPRHAQVFVIDPAPPLEDGVTVIQAGAGEGVARLAEML